jgi:hypothetical protein
MDADTQSGTMRRLRRSIPFSSNDVRSFAWISEAVGCRDACAPPARRHSAATVEAEIAKCELVCANCHAVRTFNRREREASAA